MLTRLEQTIDERTQGILRGLEARVAAFKSQLESMDKAVYDAKQREADQTARYQPYFEAKRDLENQQKIRDAMLLRKLQETVNLQIPPVAHWEIVDRAEPSLRPVRAQTGLGFGLCAAGLATGLCGLVVRGSARPPQSKAPQRIRCLGTVAWTHDTLNDPLPDLGDPMMGCAWGGRAMRAPFYRELYALNKLAERTHQCEAQIREPRHDQERSRVHVRYGLDSTG